MQAEIGVIDAEKGKLGSLVQVRLVVVVHQAQFRLKFITVKIAEVLSVDLRELNIEFGTALVKVIF